MAEFKREKTIEELELEYKKAEEKQLALKILIEKKKQEENERIEAQLALEKETRKNEVDNAIAKCKDLIKAYMRDYGIYSFTSIDDDNEIFNSKFWNWIV